MVEVTEDDKHIYIKILKRVDIDLERIYNKNYFFSLGIEIVDDKDKMEKKDGTNTGSTTETIEFVILKSGKESSFKMFGSYLEYIKKQPNLNPLTTFFGSGIDYIVLENITNDLCGCSDFMKIYGMQLIEKKMEMIFVINDRFVILTENITTFDEKKVGEEESILKLLSAICGITYSRGEDHFKPFIYGTHLYDKLKKLIQ